MTVDTGRVLMRKLKGALMPAIGLVKFGSDRYSAAEVATGVAGALEVGYRHFNLGSVFENEVEIGQVLEGSRCLSITRRIGDRPRPDRSVSRSHGPAKDILARQGLPSSR